MAGKKSMDRTARISLAVRPQTFEAVETLAKIRNSSVNNFVATILDEIAEKNSGVVDSYRETFNKLQGEINLSVNC